MSAEVTTSTQPNLYQLAVELGNPAIGFRMVGPRADGTFVVRTDAVTQAALAAAVAAHVPNPAIVPPPTPAEQQAASEAANRTIVDQRMTAAIADLENLIASPDVATVPNGTLTTAQLSSATRQLRDAVQQNRDGAKQVARVVRDLVRYVRGDFSDID